MVRHTHTYSRINVYTHVHVYHTVDWPLLNDFTAKGTFWVFCHTHTKSTFCSIVCYFPKSLPPGECLGVLRIQDQDKEKLPPKQPLTEEEKEEKPQEEQQTCSRCHVHRIDNKKRNTASTHPTSWTLPAHIPVETMCFPQLCVCDSMGLQFPMFLSSNQHEGMSRSHIYSEACSPQLWSSPDF